MKKKLLSMFLGAATAVTMLAGCTAGTGGSAGNTDQPATTTNTGSSDDKIVISIYTQYADDDTKVPYDYAVEQLKEAYPNVELNLIVQAQDDGMTLKTLAATGQLPDIYQASTDIINTFFMKQTENLLMQRMETSMHFLSRDRNMFSGTTTKLFSKKTDFQFLPPTMSF